jgi:hypothetical protein
MSEEKLIYESEDARQSALTQLPDQPPPGVADIGAWLRDVEDRKSKILAADIVAPQALQPTALVQPLEPQAQSAAPAVPNIVVNDATPAVQSSAQDVVSSISNDNDNDNDIIATSQDGTIIKRSDLPQDLKKYRNLQEILKSADHARRYANSTEKIVEQLTHELQERNKKLSEVETRQQVISTTQSFRPQAEMIGVKDRRKLDVAKETLKTLQTINPDEIAVDPSKFNTMFAQAIEAIEDIDTSHSVEVAELRRKLDEVHNEVTQVASRSDEVKRAIYEKEALRLFAKRINEFQEARPELKTNKPIFAAEGQSIERDAARFADAVILRKLGRPATGWPERNRIINAYLRNDPDTISFCEANGLTPDRYETTVNDLRNYAICLNVDKVKQGAHIDEYTGEIVPLTDFMGNPVSFPDHESAYEYLCRTSGITQRRRQEELRDAEIQGQNKLEAALHRVPVPSMGRTVVSARPAATDNIPPQDAMKMMNDINMYDMHNAALRGDRRLFNLYAKCTEALGLPSPVPDPLWPKEIVQGA